MKLITFAVPCYNSAEYMEHCIKTLLTGGEDVEIILVDDGSTKDNTGEIADRYAAQYPTIVRAIHQENGGHGEGVNQGIRNARGIYYKVVDSDDWVDEEALRKVLAKLREFTFPGEQLDMMIFNYVYEHVLDNTSHTMRYTKNLPQDRVFGWDEMKKFGISQYILMHSVVYRTELLREMKLELPKHTFYVDNIFVYLPLPHVKRAYYMDVDLYRYYIGREDQSVNESIMVKRIDQQLRITKIMLHGCDVKEIEKTQPKLGRYMFNYLSMMIVICSVFLMLDGSEEALAKKDALWKEIEETDPVLCKRLKHHSLNIVSNPKTALGRKTTIGLYRLSRKIFKFN